MAGKKLYEDSVFLGAVKKHGPDTAYGFAKALKLHNNLVRRRLKELSDAGLIVQSGFDPVTYGPKVDSKLPPPEPNLEEKKAFFAQAMELPQMEMEIINLLKRESGGLPITRICKILGYGQTIISRALNHLEKHNYLNTRKKNRVRYWMVNPSPVAERKEETKPMLSVESLLNIIQRAFADLESQIKILTAQNEAFKNVSKNTHFENRTLVDEETIRGDERNRVFASLGKIMGLGPGIIADWYKAGK